MFKNVALFHLFFSQGMALLPLDSILDHQLELTLCLLEYHLDHLHPMEVHILELSIPPVGFTQDHTLDLSRPTQGHTHPDPSQCIQEYTLPRNMW